MVNNLPASAGVLRDVSLIPGLGRSPGGVHGNPLHYSCLEIPMDRGAWHTSLCGGKELDMISTHTQFGYLRFYFIYIYIKFGI